MTDPASPNPADRPRRRRDPWLRVRRDLSPRRQRGLTALSFVVPMLLWCVVAYVPWFHGDYKLTLTPEPQNLQVANLVPGDRIAKDYFQTYTDSVRDGNAEILNARAADPGVTGSARSNLKKLRRIQPLAEANGWLDGIDASDFKALDAAFFDVWLGLADGTLTSTKLELTGDNLEIVRRNAELMKAFSPYDPDNKIKTPLENLLPQGVSASPAFLPAPHECVRAMIRDFTTEPANDQPWMYQRVLSSLGVVFGGFLIACLIGVPLGILCGSYDLFSRLFEPFSDFFRYMPAPTFGLLLVAAFGVGGAPKIALVFIGTFPHMVLMIADTARLLDAKLIEAAETLGARRTGLLRHVVVPGILPSLYEDLRTLLGWAWTWLVIAELIGTKTGLTAFIDMQGGKYNFDRVFPVIILIGVIGLATDQFLQAMAYRLFPWEFPRHRPSLFARLRRWIKPPADDEPPAVPPATSTGSPGPRRGAPPTATPRTGRPASPGGTP